MTDTAPRALIRDSARFALVALLQKGAAIISVPLLTRALGPAEFGAAMVIQQATVLGSVAISCGLDVAVVALVAEARDRAAQARLGAAGMALRLALYLPAVTLACLLAGPIAAHLLPGLAVKRAVRLAALGLLPTILVAHGGQLLQGARAHGVRAALDLVYNAALIAALIVGVGPLGLGIEAVFWPPIVAGLLLAPAYLLAARRLWQAPAGGAGMRDLLRFGLPAVPAALAAAAMTAAGPLILNAFSGPEASGRFSIAVTLGNAIHLVAVPFQLVWLPLVHARHADPDAAAGLSRAAGLAAAVLALAALSLALFAPEILLLFVGPGFREAGSLVPPVVFAVAAAALGALLAVGLGVVRALSTRAVATMLAAAAYAGLLAWAVPRGGAAAAAVLLLAAETSLAVGLAMLAHRRSGIALPFRPILLVWAGALAAAQIGLLLPTAAAAAMLAKLLVVGLVAAIAVGVGLVHPGDLRHLTAVAIGGRPPSLRKIEGQQQ